MPFADSERIGAAAFFLAVGRRARGKQLDWGIYANPLRAAAEFIRKNPDTAESRLLARIFEAVVSGEGRFRESEVFLLGGHALPIAVALIDAATCGRIPRLRLLGENVTTQLSRTRAPLSERSRHLLEIVRATGNEPSTMRYDDFLRWVADWEGKVIAGRWMYRDGEVVTID